MSFIEQVLPPSEKQLKTLQKRRAIYLRQRSSRDFRIGDPRYMTIYDNGGLDAKDGSSDRYTVVYTREVNADKATRQRGWYFVMGMSGAPYHPQGICLHSEYPNRVDKPTYKHLGKRIRFNQLPSDCQRAALRDYIYLYSLCLFGE
jgi:hypothetical protein